jgi:predicted metal-dependent enzyme (double-stranded beta helix superfamily)
MSNVVLSPGKSIRPHNHGMWSIIGIYEGREDSVLWRPLKRDFGDSIEPVSALSMSRGDVLPFGSDVIHSVTNPTEALSGAIHVYGGDFFDVERSEWDSEHLTEHICDLRELRALFG